MRLMVYSIRDAKAEAFMRPFFAPTNGMAMRSFRDAVNAGGEEPVAKHPEDYALYHIGYFDELVGELTRMDQPVMLALAITLKE